MASYVDLLSPDHFNWAYEFDEDIDVSFNNDTISSDSCLNEQAPQPEQSIISISEDSFFGEVLDSDDESVTESWGSDSNNTTATTSATSMTHNIDEKEEQEQPHQQYNTEMTYMTHNINNVFGWRNHSACYEPEIHHFNWFGEPVYQPSLTAPADSLTIILADPKVPEVKEDLRVQTLLRRAFTFLDPVVVNVEHAPRHLLLQRGSSQLQQAASECTSTYYTPHGQWMVDMEADLSKVVVDNGNIKTYMKPELAVGNGFVQSTQIRSSADWMQARADKIASLSQWKPPRKLGWKPVSSPLCQAMSLSDISPRLRRKPGREDLRASENASSPLSSPLSSLLPSRLSTLHRKPRREDLRGSEDEVSSLSSPLPTTPPSPLSTSPSTSLSTPPLTPLSLSSSTHLSTSPSTSPTTPSPPSHSPQCASPRPTPSSPLAPSSKRRTTDPSRDPETYWSFPPPKIVGREPKTSFRRALKKTVKTLMSVTRRMRS